MKLAVRSLKSADIGDLYVMSKAFNAEFNMDYPVIDDAELEKHMFFLLTTLNDPNFIYLMARDGKKPVGYFLGYISDRPYGRPVKVGVGQEAYVVPDKRGLTVGPRMIKEAVQLAIDRGAQGFECVGIYGSTQKMWEKFGFQMYLTYGYMPMEVLQGMLFKRDSTERR